MKKLNYLILGLAGLTMASCSNEDLQGPAEGIYQLTVNLPKDMATRAIGDNITAPQTLHYTVFTSEGTYVDAGTQPFATGQTSTTVNLPLVKGNSYQIAFFSQSTSSESVYTYADQTATVSVNYDAMTYGTGVDADAYDCFSYLYKIENVGGALSETVTLTRPVAQINWGTSDLNSAAVAQVFGNGATNLRTTLEATVPTTFNILDDSYGDATKVSFSNPANALPNTTEAVPISGFSYLAMQYVLAEESMTSDLTLTVSNSQESSVDDITVVVSNAPLKANYRTNIYGALLTDQASFNVTLSSTWGTPSHDIIDGAVVTFTEEGTVYCETPNLPEGVTLEDMAPANVGAVAIGADGEPVFIQPTSSALNTAMKQYSEIYLAPNSVITTQSHQMVVPQSGVTIHGNGATLEGQEQDFALAYSGVTYADGSTVNLNISNLNGVKVWNGPNSNCTVNINLTNCTQTGTDRASSTSMIMVRLSDTALGTVNLNLQNCYVQDTQVAIHSTYPGTVVLNNCVFTNVGIPLNIAKKRPLTSNVTVSNCIFNTCGILPTDISNNAYDYAAPVRVVDNGGPSNSITLLVENCTFEKTLSEWDILLWDYRAGKTSFPVTCTIKNCTPAEPKLATINKETTNPKD